jgi:hypothetical protein
VRRDYFRWTGDQILKASRVCGLAFTQVDDLSDIKPAARHLALWSLHEEFGHLGCSDTDIERLLALVVQVEVFIRPNGPEMAKSGRS